MATRAYDQTYKTKITQYFALALLCLAFALPGIPVWLGWL